MDIRRWPEMAVSWYFVLYAIVAIWVFLDAKKRGNNAPAWAVASFLIGIIVAPYYLAKRYLLAGEVREGGVAWNVLRYFAIFWTLSMVLVTFAGVGAVASDVPTFGNEYEEAGYAIGATLGVGMLITLWFIVLVAALVLGMFLKKSSIVEKGPTGPLAAPSASPVSE
jgi:membrane protease YdiL (CAAX protease family)